MGVHMKEHVEEGKFDLTNVCHSGAVVLGSYQFVEEFARHSLAGFDMVRYGLHHIPIQNEVLHELARHFNRIPLHTADAGNGQFCLASQHMMKSVAEFVENRFDVS